MIFRIETQPTHKIYHIIQNSNLVFLIQTTFLVSLKMV